MAGKPKKMKALPMEHNNAGTGLSGVMITVLIWAFAKITLAGWANVATITSGVVVFIINLPKLIATIKNLFRKNP